jgi:uncharacterized membrane protein
LIPLDVPGTPFLLSVLAAAGLRFLQPVTQLAAVLVSTARLPWDVWLPYLTGALILAVGLPRVINKDFVHQRALNQIVALGPLLLAAPIAIFGLEHFLFPAFVARMVPAWIPGPLFWTFVTGVCFIGAALSIAVKKYAGFTAALLGLMILLFVFLIDIPGIVSSHGGRLFWMVALRDLSFSGGAFAVAAIHTDAWGSRTRGRLITLARFFIAIPVIFFGVAQFVHPELAPGIPLAKLTPLFIPAHLLWSYLTGIVFVVIGMSLLINKEVRLAATWLGLTLLLLVFIVYVPIVVANPWDIGNGLNYLADALLLSGSALAFAGARRANFPLEHLSDRKILVARKAESPD